MAATRGERGRGTAALRGGRWAGIRSAHPGQERGERREGGGREGQSDTVRRSAATACRWHRSVALSPGPPPPPAAPQHPPAARAAVVLFTKYITVFMLLSKCLGGTAGAGPV